MPSSPACRSRRRRSTSTPGTCCAPADGTPATLPLMSIADPYNLYGGPVNYIRASLTQGSLDNQALYAFDTLTFDEHWMLNLGARYEHNEGDTIVDTVNICPGQPHARSGDRAFGGSKTRKTCSPIELACSSSRWTRAPSTSPTPTARRRRRPLSTASLLTAGRTPVTLIRKARSNRDSARSGTSTTASPLNAAVFRNDREEFKVADPGNPANPSGEQQLDGEARVDGVTFGVAGQILQGWSVFANVTFLESEVLQGVSDACIANPSTACGNSAAVPDPIAGRAISGRRSALAARGPPTTWSAWIVGYGVTYQSSYDYYTGTGANAGDIKGYTTHARWSASTSTTVLASSSTSTTCSKVVLHPRPQNGGPRRAMQDRWC